MADKIAQVGVWLVLSTLSIGFALFADGMADGKVLSLSGLWSDLLALDPGILLRIIFWLMVLGPIAWLAAMLMGWRKHTERG